MNVPREMLRNTHTIYSLNGMWSSEGWSQYQPVQDKLGVEELRSLKIVSCSQ